MNKEQKLNKQLEELNSFADKVFGQQGPQSHPSLGVNRQSMKAAEVERCPRGYGRVVFNAKGGRCSISKKETCAECCNQTQYILWPIAPGYFLILPNNMNMSSPPEEGDDAECK